ncbi:MAG: RNA pyrophosphohydrolase [Alphaproteobacteria bacterium]|nr:MAG: RNA pyrophosphohydrolase [Alphaproteobacteria bacterium]
MNYNALPEQGGRDPSLYRPNVGLAIFSKKGHLWLGRRAGVRKDDARYAWQMPQGGIDRGETPAIAALRELGEETGINTSHVELLEELEPWLYYDFPPALKAKLTGPYYGQRQKWFAYRFTGSDTDFRLDDHTPEFDAWKWAKLEDAAGLVIPFKAAVYEEVAKRFVKWTEV